MDPEAKPLGMTSGKVASKSVLLVVFSSFELLILVLCFCSLKLLGAIKTLKEQRELQRAAKSLNELIRARMSNYKQ